MTLKEKKRKLSEILGINIFDPKYKGIDTLLGGEENEAKEAEQSKEEQPKEEQSATNDSEETADTAETGSKDTETAKTAAEDKDTADGSEEGESEPPVIPQSNEGDVTETDNVEEQEGAEKPSESAAANDDELFDAKLEAKLLRAGVREDRLDAAKKLFKADFTLADIEKVGQFIKEYPEWTKQKSKEQAKNFGMDVGDHDSAESAEERRLRELGIA